MAIPKLVIFDLDYTLWPFWVDTHVDPPFKKKSNGTIYDRNGQTINHYPGVPEMLQRLLDEGYIMGVASRTGAIPEAEELLKLFDWNKYFQYKEIYPGSKTKHFKRFRGGSGFDYEEMLFFDDEGRNIRDVGEFGVTCILAKDGMTEDILQKGFQTFANNHRTKQPRSS